VKSIGHYVGEILKKNHDSSLDLDYLEFNERQTKTRTGDDVRNVRDSKPRMYATPNNPDKCPVALYNAYQAKRPTKFSESHHPFYLATVTNTSTPGQGDQWFCVLQWVVIN